jgi:hypothetical protein
MTTEAGAMTANQQAMISRYKRGDFFTSKLPRGAVGRLDNQRCGDEEQRGEHDHRGTPRLA